MEHLLNKLNATVEKILEKVDAQGTKIAELSVKVDMYRDVQTEHSRKLETVDKTAIEAMQSTKAAHKRMDTLEEIVEDAPTKVEHANHDYRIEKLEKIVYWVGTLIIGTVILSVLGLVLVK